MRKSNILILLLVLLSSSCTAQTSNKDIISTKPKAKDFSYLKIQTVLPPEDKAYYKRVHNEVSEIAKHFAYREENAEKKYCPVLGKMFDEISVRPISRERERERERQVNLLFYLCNRDNVFSESYKPITCEEYKYISTKITNSASIFSALANYEGNFLFDKKLSSETRSKHKKKFKFYWNQSLLVDSVDLFPLKRDDDLKEEYCKKALDTMQWDHIYYISNEYTDTGFIINVLKDDSIQNNTCVKVLKVALKGWSKEDLYSGEMINPTADEFSNPNQYKITQQELRDWMKKRIGRDLDKEPRVEMQQY